MPAMGSEKGIFSVTEVVEGELIPFTFKSLHLPIGFKYNYS